MVKQTVSNFFKGVQKAVSKRSPEILTAIGITGMVSTTILAVKATPKALKQIDEAKINKMEIEDDEIELSLTPIETIKVAWKPYVPAAITGSISIACLIFANTIHAKRTAALATAYQLSATALNEYKEKVIETIGEKKEKTIREQVAQEKVNKNPVSTTEVIIAGSGSVLFLEPVSMRYFESDIERIRKIINDINYQLSSGMNEYISLSQFYDEIGLSHTHISDDIGWNIGRDGLIDINFPATKADDGRPCLVLEYQVEPRRDYYKISY